MKKSAASGSKKVSVCTASNAGMLSTGDAAS